MNKKIFFLLMMFLCMSFCASAQHACDLSLVPEGDNLCILGRRNDDFLLVRACRGNTIGYHASSASEVDYQWSVVGGEYQLSDDRSVCYVTWGNGNTGLVTVSAVRPDSSVCTSQIQIVLEDKPIARVISTPNYVVDASDPEEKWIEVCSGDSLSFIDNSISGDRPIVDYYWEFPYGISNSRSISFVAGASGEYPIVHRVYNECGCYDEVVVRLIVRDECPLELSCFGTACANSMHQYSLYSPKCSDYYWTAQGGSVVSPQHRQDVVVQWGEPESGYGMLCLDGVDCDCDCKSRKSIAVPVISGNVPIAGPDTLCVGNLYDFSVPLWGATEYTWDISPDDGFADSASGNHLYFTPLVRQSYTISVSYSCDFLGCGPFTVSKTAVALSPLSIDTSPSTENVCIGSELAFSTNTTDASQWSVSLDDSIVHTANAPILNFAFDAAGFYLVTAQNHRFCCEASMAVQVKDAPPAPAQISGPDTICPYFTAEYSAVPTSSDYYILWEWNVDGTSHSYSGNSANITFGQVVEDIYVYQVNRRTGCRSEAVVYHVSPFRLAPWPYHDIVKVCQGQQITLDDLRDQSSHDVLYEWKTYPAFPLSIQGSHVGAELTILGNHTDEQPPLVQLVLKRTFCHSLQYDVAYVRVGEIGVPEIIHDPLCEGNPTSFTTDNPDDADQQRTYWYLESNEDQHFGGVPAHISAGVSGQDNLVLHYVSKYGCEVETTVPVVVCDQFPPMEIVADADIETLSVSGIDDCPNCTLLWSTGETTQSIEYTSDDVYCTVTNQDCGCVKSLSRLHSSSSDCVEVDQAFNIENHCYNIISINNLSGEGLLFPVDVTLTQDGRTHHHTIHSEDQRLLVPGAGDYSVAATWNHEGVCHKSTVYGSIDQIVEMQLQNDCAGHLVVSLLAGDPRISMRVTVRDPDSDATVAQGSGRNSLSILMPGTGLFKVRINLNANADCYYDTMFHFSAPPSIQSIDLYRTLCEQIPFVHSATATGEQLTYQWNFGDGSWNYGNGIEHVYEYGYYDVRLIVTDRYGCAATGTAQIRSVDNYLDEYGLRQLSSAICPGESVELSVDAGNSNSYSWTPCYWVSSHQAFVYEAGTYIVDITSSRDHCRKQLELNVPYPNGPSATIVCDSTYCQDETATLIGDIGSDFSYRWHIQSAHVDDYFDSPNLRHIVSDTGYYQVILQVSDFNGCTAFDTARFYVHPTPEAPGLQFCGNRCITDGAVKLCSSDGAELLWSNGAKGASSLFFTDGLAGAYLFDPVSGCRSRTSTFLIPEAPDFGGLLTGCYCIPKSHLPDSLPLYSLGPHAQLPWEWIFDENQIGNGTLPPSPSLLELPGIGEYHLSVTDYGQGCGTISPALIIESENCNYQQDSRRDRIVEGFVVKKECEQDGCSLSYQITAQICNRTDAPVCIDDIHPALPISYSVTSGLPMTLNPGECQDVTLVMQYDYSSPSVFVFEMDCGDEMVGAFPVSLSDWMSCVHPDTCAISAIPSFVIDTTLSTPNHSAFFHLGLSFPSISGNVISVSCDLGQLIDGSCSGSSYSALLMLDYGLLSQLVLDSADICFRIVCCTNGRICVSTICLPLADFWELCGLLNFQGKSRQHADANNILADEGKSFLLTPNPTADRVRIADPKGRSLVEDIGQIEVFALNGQKVLAINASDQFDASRLSSGSYIVKVTTVKNRHEYLKLIKK